MNSFNVANNMLKYNWDWDTRTHKRKRTTATTKKTTEKTIPFTKIPQHTEKEGKKKWHYKLPFKKTYVYWSNTANDYTQHTQTNFSLKKKVFMKPRHLLNRNIRLVCVCLCVFFTSFLFIPFFCCTRRSFFLCCKIAQVTQSDDRRKKKRQSSA